VAGDYVCVDLVNECPVVLGSALKKHGPGTEKFKDIYPQVDGYIQLEYASQLRLGAREYHLVKV
jgi:uncharacterized Fe-S center protein